MSMRGVRASRDVTSIGVAAQDTTAHGAVIVLYEVDKAAVVATADFRLRIDVPVIDDACANENRVPSSGCNKGKHLT